MGKIYAPPTEIGTPEFDWSLGWDEIQRQENEYLDKLKAWVKLNNPTEELAGEIIKFQVADGYAQYMVGNLKPITLIHIPLGDRYQYQYAHRLTAKDIKEEVERGKAWAKLFKKHA